MTQEKQTSGTLFIVATPIGNMGDLTFRAKETLETADIIVAEDTRTTKKIFSVYEIPTEGKFFWSHHAKSSEKSMGKIFSALEEGKDIAFVSDAGTPGISDPGTKVVGEVKKRGLKVSPIPGASAIISALSVSGLPTDKFTFLGFMPHKKGRQTLMKDIAEAEHTMCFYESVHRISKCIDEMQEYFPEKIICIAREITKKFEDIEMGTPEYFQKKFLENPDQKKGEFVVLVSGKKFSKKYTEINL